MKTEVKSELDALIERMNENPEHIENEKDRTFQFNLEESGTIQILFDEGKISMQEGAQKEPHVTLKLSDKNFIKLLKGELNTTMAFMTGGLKVDGNLGLALKLQEIVKRYQ